MCNIIVSLCAILFSSQSDFNYLIDHINAIEVYEYFKIEGYTTSSAILKFSELRTSNCSKIKLSDTEVNKFKSVLKRSKVQKHFQTKIGTKNIFLRIHCNKESFACVFCYDDLIINLTSGIQYLILEKEDIVWINSLIKKINDNDQKDKPVD